VCVREIDRYVERECVWGGPHYLLLAQLEQFVSSSIFRLTLLSGMEKPAQFNLRKTGVCLRDGMYSFDKGVTSCTNKSCLSVPP